MDPKQMAEKILELDIMKQSYNMAFNEAFELKITFVAAPRLVNCTETLAPGSGSPASSVTFPEITASSCAKEMSGLSRATHTKSTKRILHLIIFPPQKVN